MNTFNCLATAFVTIILLPAVAASADPAKKACQKGRARFDKQDYDVAIAEYTETIHLDPKNAQACYNRAFDTQNPVTDNHRCRPAAAGFRQARQGQELPEPLRKG